MAISYKKLWILLLKKGMTKTQFREQVDISTGTLAKLGKNQPVGPTVLRKICTGLSCDISDIMDLDAEKDE